VSTRSMAAAAPPEIGCRWGIPLRWALRYRSPARVLKRRMLLAAEHTEIGGAEEDDQLIL